MEITLSLRTVTDTFVSGADGVTPELRWPSIAGPLRFWFRAMMGKVVGGDLQSLRHLEAVVFGSTDACAPFRPRISWQESPETVAAGTLRRLTPGYGYLGFSLHEWVKEEKQHRLTRGYYPPNQAFSVSLSFRRHDLLLCRVLIGSFWLLVHFGGIGSRSRRGFGVVAAESPSEQDCFIFQPASAIGPHYRSGLIRVEEAFRAFAQRHRDGENPRGGNADVAEFSSFADWRARLVAQEEWRSVNDWFDTWGVLLRGFRNDAYLEEWPWNLKTQFRKTTRDYQRVVSQYMDGKPPETGDLLNDAMGLPLVIQSSTRGRMQASVGWRERKSTDEPSGRRASPLMIRPVPLPGGGVAGLAAVFVARCLPDDALVELTRRGAKALPIAAPTHGDIREIAEELAEYLDESYKPRSNRRDLLFSLP